MKSSKENRYPQTDREIRIYCIETVQDPFCGYSDIYIEQARKLYDFITEIPPDVMEELQELEKQYNADERLLRLWFMTNHNLKLHFPKGYEWLRKGLEEGDLSLRMSCLRTPDMGIFRTPQEMLEWVKFGRLPLCYRKEENPEVPHTKDERPALEPGHQQK